MTRNRSLVLAALVSGGILLLCRSASVADENAVDASKAKMVMAAKDTLESIQASYTRGIANKATAEDIYLWSHRLMEAEKESGPNGEKAAAQHALRMRELYARLEAEHRFGRISLRELSATTYYLEKALSEQQQRSQRPAQ